MTALVTIAPKLTKLIPLLDSDKDGEVVATARAIGRALKQAGADFHDLAAALAAPPSRSAWPPSDALPRRWADIPRSEQTVWLRAMLESCRISPWEQNFATSILVRRRYRPWSELSTKQQAILDRIVGKLVEGS